MAGILGLLGVYGKGGGAMTTYHIEKVSDFLAVPADKMDLCLEEFKVAVTIARDWKDISSFQSVDWIDDDKRDVTINFKVVAP
jgi:hypothetical protein